MSSSRLRKGEGRGQSWNNRTLTGDLIYIETGKINILEKKKIRPDTKIHKGFLEEEEQRNISRQLTETYCRQGSKCEKKYCVL